MRDSATGEKTMTITTEQFEAKLAEFVPGLEALVGDYYRKAFPGNTLPKFSIERGVKYIRVVRADPHKSAYCFLDFQGNIYKCEGWKKPAKHIRGSIFDEKFSFGKGLGPYGATYLR
jgi:hypothetical protein